MKRFHYIAALMTLMLCGCLQQRSQELEQCTAEADARYPSSASIPPGQPYKDIYACMWNKGYDLDNHMRECKSSDYTVNVANPACYRPKNFFTGFFYDISALAR